MKHYDVYKTKHEDEARRCFVILADTLAKEHIDPSLYLKVLSKYGPFGKYHKMPTLTWIVSYKALRVFDWMLEAERSKFIRHEDWIRHLNDPGLENSRHICKSIRRSWAKVEDTMDRFNLKIGEATLIQADRLSPWFLAICTSFHRLGGMDVLEPKDRAMVERCVRHLASDKGSFREALDEYSKFR